jgi:hypothetical protein
LLDFLPAECGEGSFGEGLRSGEEFSAELSLLSLPLGFVFFAEALVEDVSGSLTFLAHFSHSS